MTESKGTYIATLAGEDVPVGPDELAGMTVRATSGSGEVEHRTILSNTDTMLTVSDDDAQLRQPGPAKWWLLPIVIALLVACLLFAQWIIVPESYQYPGEPTAVTVGTYEIAWMTCLSEDGCRVLAAPHWEYLYLEYGECCEHCHPDKGLFAGGDECVVPVTPASEGVRYGTPENTP